jgi:hypothetical protein
LAEKAVQLRPDQLQKLASRLADILNPDGKFDDKDRARRRGFTWGRQQADGMSEGKLVATPEVRAGLDAFMAKFAAPGMANPDDESPTVNGSPSEEAITTDNRSLAQRQHDALALLVRSQLGVKKLGAHNGIPVTIVASTTVQELEDAAGWAATAGDTRLSITDLIKMASHSVHYLVVFDGAENRPLYLGRTKRIASGDQRLVLYHQDRGCTYPGCTVPGYLTEVHHCTEWAQGGPTDIENLTLACKPHHRLITTHGWITRKNNHGQTEWIPPPGSPLKGGTNTYHHPERLLDDDQRNGSPDPPPDEHPD